MLLVGYCYGIRSERRLCEEVHLNLAYRWFCRLGLDGEVPEHSTFSKNTHGRFRDRDLLRKLFAKPSCCANMPPSEKARDIELRQVECAAEPRARLCQVRHAACARSHGGGRRPIAALAAETLLGHLPQHVAQTSRSVPDRDTVGRRR
jgi:hypothetical protein